jgi:hypothetical protein
VLDHGAARRGGQVEVLLLTHGSPRGRGKAKAITASGARGGGRGVRTSGTMIEAN